MRRIYVKRQFSFRVLLPFERQTIGKIPLRQPITQKDGTIKMMQNPYLTNLLIERYKVYQHSLDNKHSLTAYYDAVRYWYLFKGFVDKNGEISPWEALREYEYDYKRRHPDSEWHTPEKETKSHHSKSKWSVERERQKKIAWRQTEAGKRSTRMSKERAKQKRLEGK